MAYSRLHHDRLPSPTDLGSDSAGPRSAYKRTATGDIQDSSDFEVVSDNGEYELDDLSSDRPDAFRTEDEGRKTSRRTDRQDSVSTTHSFMLYTPDEENAVKHKFDRRLVLFVAFLYMLSFLDRSNIGNAKIAGMSRDLKLSSTQFEWLLRAFYIMYISFEWMTLLWKIFPPHIYLAVCVCSWGVIASLQALAFSFWSMMILRALLGIGEAAFVGIPFFLSFFYKRDELALRTGLFISAAPLATSFAGTLAWCITRFGDHIPIASWRTLLLVEGFPSVVVAVFVYLHLPDGPEHAKYLTGREKKVARLRLRKEKDEPSKGAENRKVTWADIRETLKDPKCYLTAAMFFCCNVAFSSLPVFLPTIIEEMGYTALQSQALSAPPHLVAFITVLLTAYLSDLKQTRSPFIIFHTLLASAGYTLMAVAGAWELSARWRYLGVYPATMGFFSAITIIITWTLNNQASSTGRGTGLAVLNYVGQLGPLVGVHLYPDRDGPFYVKGMSACAAFMAVVAVLAVVLRTVLARKNRQSAATAAVALEESAGDGEEEGLVQEGKGRRVTSRFVYMI